MTENKCNLEILLNFFSIQHQTCHRLKAKERNAKTTRNSPGLYAATEK
jgi:hypothetical protein